MTISALIVAAGSGSRLKSDIPKQYLALGNRLVIDYSIQTFIKHPSIDNVALVISDAHKEFYAPILSKYKNIVIVNGGAERSDSVKAGLEILSSLKTEKVLIHDAARPFMSSCVIDRILTSLETELATIPVIPVADTIKTGQGHVEETVDRRTLNQVQTPQGFCFNTLREVYKNLPSFTDDAQAMEESNVPVALVEGDEMLFKITTPYDYTVAQSMLKSFGGIMNDKR